MGHWEFAVFLSLSLIGTLLEESEWSLALRSAVSFSLRLFSLSLQLSTCTFSNRHQGEKKLVECTLPPSSRNSSRARPAASSFFYTDVGRTPHLHGELKPSCAWFARLLFICFLVFQCRACACGGVAAAVVVLVFDVRSTRYSRRLISASTTTVLACNVPLKTVS